MNYYLVDAVCGHIGKNNGIVKCFPIKANTAKEAALICRNEPRVKHHLKSGIRSVEEVSIEDYRTQRDKNRTDPFFFSTCRRESYSLGMDYDSVFSMEDFSDSDMKRKQNTQEPAERRKISQKKYMNHYQDNNYKDDYKELFCL